MGSKSCVLVDLAFCFDFRFHRGRFSPLFLFDEMADYQRH